METLQFPIVDLIENACLPKLMIEQVERRCDEAKEKIQGLDHISIEDVDKLIKQRFYIEGKIHIFVCICSTSWLKIKWKILIVMLNLGLNQQIIQT